MMIFLKIQFRITLYMHENINLFVHLESAIYKGNQKKLDLTKYIIE